nr:MULTISPECIES: HIT domain-containing protein [unclassified Plantibacter]
MPTDARCPVIVRDTCPFCAIVAGNAPARVVAETPTSVSFLPDVPAVLGHVLVVPRCHVSDLWDLDEEQARALGADVLATSRVVRDALQPAGLNIIQSNGAAAGQSVFHLHVHVVPRTADDRMPDLWPKDAHWDTAQLDSVARELRSETLG